LIVHISSIGQLDKWAVDIPDYAIKLAKAFWPGPMTLILKRGNRAKDFITGFQSSIGLRVPNHELALSLLKKFETLGGLGVAAPSANKFGAVSPTTVDAVDQELGELLGYSDLVLDGGQSSIGLESTIIDCTKRYPTILRPGAITKFMIEIYSGIITQTTPNNDSPKFPGSFKAHYAPRTSLILDSVPVPGDGFIALSEIETPKGTIRLASPKNSKEYAQCLYEALRSADKQNLKRIVAILPKGSTIEEAIRDRLDKASGIR
jgi:L-threonylcarbamoyladenylate synthase